MILSLLAATAALAVGQGTPPYAIQVAPFTDAKLPDAAILAMGSAAYREGGTVGENVDAATPIELSGLKLNPVEGMIEVWIRPRWSGNDGRRHLLWSTEEAAGRQLLLEKSELGLLRAVIKTPGGLTVSRADVSGWKPGTWHHVAVGWTSHNGANVGLPLWIDRVAVDGQITTHGVWTATSLPSHLTLSDAEFDELVVRPKLDAEGGYGMVACVYRDYFRTAPISSIRIDTGATQVPSDPRAVAGYAKQLGLSILSQGKWQPVIENVVRYSQWGYFDARRQIQWRSSNDKVATVDSAGRLNAIREGHCTIWATFHNIEAQFPLTVISSDKPDLDAIGIELLPRFRSDAVADRLRPGDSVNAQVRIGNFGLAPLPAGATVRFSLIRRRNGDFHTAPKAKPDAVFEQTIGELKPGKETVAEFKWSYPAQSTWMKVELDPENKVDELCKANNTIEELTDARPIHMGFNPRYRHEEFDKHELNHIGSFSYYDWVRSEKLRMDVMLRDAVFPTTSEFGVQEAYRIDKFTALESIAWDDEPFNKESTMFDGGYPVNEKVDLASIDCAIIHELGHTVLSQPDLYGYGTVAKNVFVTDDEGKLVAGTPEFPVVSGDDNLPSPPATNVPCAAGYPSLMDGCQLWLPSSMAGHIMYYRGYRPDRFWGTQGRLVPTRANWLLVSDAYDHPLKQAAVYVYHVTQAPVQDSGAKYFADRPKFVGQTDDEGRSIFPNETDQDWDDPKTDEVEGTRSVGNPFGTATTDSAFTPNVWEVEGLLLVRVVSGKHSEYRFMDLTQFNDEFLAGHTVCGVYRLRTSLEPSPTPTAVVRKPIPDAIRTVNKAPVAVAPAEITVKCGETYTIDGSKSYDPEGQPLIYRWNVGEGWLRGSVSQAAKLQLRAPDKPQELSFKFWVIDGIRCSQPVQIKVHVKS
ncbi:MAG: Ig-like domain-containing protein [Fimbriimonas sp.]|nr:Ig-like domain-containing protein [Fimbriimonas sp.]